LCITLVSYILVQSENGLLKKKDEACSCRFFILNFVVPAGNNYRLITKVSRLNESRKVNFYILGSRF